jgi:hypothetical protein
MGDVGQGSTRAAGGVPTEGVRRAIQRIIPSAGNRRALLERGDADISCDLPSKDFSELRASPKLTIIGTPVENATQYIGMNVKRKPFDDARVRQAVGGSRAGSWARLASRRGSTRCSAPTGTPSC